jgi:gluconolactonase
VPSKFLLSCALLLFPVAVACAADDYKLGHDSQYQAGVPKGEVSHYTWTSKVFPGTVRDYWVYVPKQYDAATPACVMVFQDGGGFQNADGQYRVPVVFDNLIHKKEMPVTIAVMINPGVVPSDSQNALPRYNRSFEYDTPSDQYARFLLDEILPEVGRKYNLTKDPNGRALCGSSSGGICSFVAAWERPDQFGKVISFIGSFTNLRGGHNLSSLIRKTEPKPIRVFMQDGSNDQDIYSGSWFIGNNDVAAALRYARYDYQYVVGDGGHSGRHGGAILPDALRWLWRDYPTAIKKPDATPQPVMEVLLPGEDWRIVDDGPAGALAGDGAGRVVQAGPKGTPSINVFPDRAMNIATAKAGGARSIAFGPDSRLYVAMPNGKRLVAFDTLGKQTTVARDIDLASLTVNRKGDIYGVDARDGRVWHIDKGGRKAVADTGIPNASAVALSPDQTLLFVAQSSPGNIIYSYHVKPVGSLADKQAYFDLHVPYTQPSSGATAMATDTQGRLYVATTMGIQVLDQAGRVNGIILNPTGIPATSIAFGGPNLEYLYACAGGKLYRRKTKVKGVLSFQDPIKPPTPRL